MCRLERRRGGLHLPRCSHCNSCVPSQLRSQLDLSTAGTGNGSNHSHSHTCQPPTQWACHTLVLVAKPVQVLRPTNHTQPRHRTRRQREHRSILGTSKGNGAQTMTYMQGFDRRTRCVLETLELGVHSGQSVVLQALRITHQRVEQRRTVVVSNKGLEPMHTHGVSTNNRTRLEPRSAAHSTVLPQPLQGHTHTQHRAEQRRPGQHSTETTHHRHAHLQSLVAVQRALENGASRRADAHGDSQVERRQHFVVQATA